MKSTDEFGRCHPLVNFLYFGIVLGFTMFFMNPACLLISLLCALSYYIKLKGSDSVHFLIKFAFPSMLLAALVNPAFNHRGMTILCYLPTGNPLTLESIVYGIAAAVMLAAVLLWFSCFTEIITSDKFVYLFGRVIPALSLVLSMALRFVPHFKAQLNAVREARKAVGADTDDGSVPKKIKSAVSCFSATVTWALENAIDTADSMKSRGYGLKGRTSFSIYTFTERDKYITLWLLFCFVYFLSGALSGGLYWQYFPDMSGAAVSPLTVSFYAVYGGLCLTPVIIDKREEIRWKSLQ